MPEREARVMLDQIRKRIRVPSALDDLGRFDPAFREIEGGAPFAWVRLSDLELQQCSEGADKRLGDWLKNELGQELGNQNAHAHADRREAYRQAEILWRAMRDPASPGEPHDPYPRRLARSPEALTEAFDPLVRVALVQAYADFRAGLLPAEIRPLDGDELRAAALELRRDPRAMQPAALRNLALGLAAENARLRQGAAAES